MSSGIFYIDSLLAPDEFRWNFNAPGTPLTVTYGFMTTMPAYSSSPGFGFESPPFQAFTAAQRDAVDRAVALFESVAKVDFVFRADGDNAQIRFGSAVLDPGEAAHTYYPDPSAGYAGDVWFNSTDPDMPNQSAGTYGFMATLHEMGHALGLKHSFEDGTILPFDRDNRQYTVMSYREPTSMSDVEPSSLMLYDIATLQYLYGANTSYLAGNTNWRWNPNETFRYCIWDGGGNDTLDASNQTRRVIIDLNPGTFSSVGSYKGGDAIDNLSIAYNCWIENANGGSGNDTITGNQLDNRIDGGAGNDVITGGDGNDQLYGGDGNDILNGGSGADRLDGGAGFDIVSFADRIDSVLATEITEDIYVSIEQIVGSSWHDTLVAHSGVTWLIGGAGFDTLVSGATADTLDGGTDPDTVSYVNSNAAVYVNLATNVVSGGYATGDTLISIESATGSAFDDVLIGNANSNWLTGGAGNDYLDGGGGMDTYIGGLGDDIFILDTPQIGSSVGEDNNVFENPNEGIDEIRTTANAASLRENIENLTFIGSGSFIGGGNGLDNRITGGAGNDTLAGGYGNDTLIGGDGDDLLSGGSGADALIGGNGFDTISYEFSGPVRVDLAGGVQSGDAAGDTYSGIEAVIGSSAYDDELYGDSGDNTFQGLGGRDTIDGRGGIDTAVYTGRAEDYLITVSGNVKTITPLRGTLKYLESIDTLIDIENIRFDGTNANHAPIVSGMRPIYRNSDNRVDWLITVSDADMMDSVERYEIRAQTSGGSYLSYNGVVVAQNQLLSLTRTEMVNLNYHAATGAGVPDQIQVRVFDGVAWSAQTTLTVALSNQLPFVSAASQAPTHANSPMVVSSFMTGGDPDGDPIVRYEFTDFTPNFGYFVLNGVVQAQTFQVTAAEFNSLQFVPGVGAIGSDYIQVRAFDGADWGGATYLYIDLIQNVSPIVSASNLTPSHGTGFVAASSMFSVSDGDNDSMKQYEFRDNTTGGGYFRLNGVQQAASFQIAANQLANLQFVPTSATGGQDLIDVRAFDGFAWSNWKSFTVGAVPNVSPTVNPVGAALTRGMSSVAAASLIASNDGDGDTISRYRFFDGTTGNGRFALNGTPQAENVNIEITSAQLAGLQFTLGAPGTSDIVWAQVFDGFVWSNWTSFTVTAPQNAAPAATVSDRSPARGTATLAAASLVSATDPDGDAITAYKFFDGTIGSGHFRKNGLDQAEQVNIDVSAAELATTEFVLGSGSDVLWVQVFDGASWSAWKSFTVFPPANNAPVVSINAGALNPGKGTPTVAASSFFTVTDADSDTITQYRFFDGNAGNGRFELNSNPQVELTNITINASDLANFRYRTSTTGTGDTLWVQAFDGIGWSAWKSFNVAAPPNALPVIAINSANLNPAHGTATVAASSFFSVTDADNDTITQYRFFDGNAGNGVFELNGNAKVELTNIPINASDLANFRYRVSGTGTGDTLWVQAFDGTAWSAWKSFNVSAPANNVPVVTVNQASLSPARGTATIAASSFFSVADADNDTITKFRFFDGNASNGRFQLNGQDQVELTNIEINASDLANFRYRTSATGTGDTLWVQAFDGTAWSAWKSFNVAAPTNIAPTVFVEDWVYADDPSTIAASALFVINDPDDANMVRYRFFDSGIDSGRFRLNGVDQQQQRNIEIDAADLPNLVYVKGASGKETLWVQAFDGTTWSQWKSFEAKSATYGLVQGGISAGGGNISFLQNTPPVVTASNASARVGTSVAISALVNATDADGDAITAWRFRDTTAGRGVFRVDGVVQPDDSWHWVDVAANQLGSVDFLAGNTPGFNRLDVMAFDGTEWSEWKPFVINTLASS